MVCTTQFTAFAAQVYDAIQSSSGFFSSPVEASVRSNMNIPFTIPSDAALEKDFLQESSKKNMVRHAVALLVCDHCGGTCRVSGLSELHGLHLPGFGSSVGGPDCPHCCNT